jgi:hypothetical protein
MAQQHKNDMLVPLAKAVLDVNWIGEYTKPGPRLYPHQWSWDSALKETERRISGEEDPLLYPPLQRLLVRWG